MKFEITHNNSNNSLMVKPLEEMSDFVYNDYKLYFEAMGGHWREKNKAFIFYKDILNRGKEFEAKERMQFFPTPDAISQYMTTLAGLDSSYWSYHDARPCILEPSAGDGQLLKFIDSSLRGNEYVIEPDFNNVQILASKGYNVQQTTFEDFYDRMKTKPRHITHIIMNPPFSRSRDILHTMMAYELLTVSGVLVGIVSENSLYYKGALNKKFRKWLKDTNAYTERITGNKFASSGTTIDTMIIKIVKQS